MLCKLRQGLGELGAQRSSGWRTKKEELNLNVGVPCGRWMPCERVLYGAYTIEEEKSRDCDEKHYHLQGGIIPVDPSL